jgi:Protein of unknown function (DUF2726)
MDAIAFLQSNNDYLVLALVLTVLLFLLLQYLIDYLFIGRNFKRPRKLHPFFNRRQRNMHHADRDNVVELGSNRRAFPIPEKKPPLQERLRRRNNFEAKNILNVSEQRFFRHLSDCLNDCHIFPQVSFNALITHASWISSNHWQQMVRSKFNAKYVDFVVCSRSDFQVIAVVEYDGPGHRNTHDEERDILLRGAGYRVERFTHFDSADTIRHRFGLLVSSEPESDKSGSPKLSASTESILEQRDPNPS